MDCVDELAVVADASESCGSKLSSGRSDTSREISSGSSRETRKAKGVKKNVIKKSLTFEDYKKCLTEDELMKKMNIIRSQNHDIYSMTVNKVALSANDDKRLICENKINTLVLRSTKK